MAESESRLVVPPGVVLYAQDIAESESEGRVVVVLPTWGGGLGGIYSEAHSLVQALRRTGHPVACILGITSDHLSDGDRDHIQQLGVTVLEPNIEEEDQPRTPEQRVQDADSLGDVYDNVSELTNVTHVVSFSKHTHSLANRLIHSVDSPDCELITINHERNLSKEEVGDLAEYVISSKAVFSIGLQAFQFFNTEMKSLSEGGFITNHKIIPDFLTLLGKPFEHSADDQPRIFLPLTGLQDDNFVRNCVCAVNLCNETLTKTNQMERIMHVTVQIHDHGDQQDFTTCLNNDHLHRQCHYEVCTSRKDVTKTACKSSLIMASGQFTETGFSGLEFLMNGYLTFFPDRSDVAEILSVASPGGFASLFLLKAMDGLMSPQHVLSEWETKLHATMSGKENLRKKAGILVKDLYHHASFIDGQRYFLEAFGASVPTSPQDDASLIGMFGHLGGNTLIGTGSVGVVHRLDATTAVKVIPVEHKGINKKAASREIKVLGHLCTGDPHGHIIGLFGCYYSQQYIYILMELAQLSMEQFIKDQRYKKLSKEEKTQVLQQVFGGLQHLHNKMIVHQDIKPSNILFTDGLHVKLSDFGTARIRMSHSTTFSMITSNSPGTPYYQAPEVLIEGRRAQPCSDVWSACLVGTEWFTGKQSWKLTGPRNHTLMKQNGTMPGQLIKVPQPIQHILAAGLSYCPKDRPNAERIQRALENPSDTDLQVLTRTLGTVIVPAVMISQWSAACEPYDLTVTPAGNVVVFGGHSGVHIHDQKGKYVTRLDLPQDSWAKGGTCIGEEIIVADRHSGNLMVHDTSGHHKETLPTTIPGTWGVSASNQYVYITCCREPGSVHCLDLQKTTEDVKQFASHSESVPLYKPAHIAANATLVAVSCKECVHVYDVLGKHLTTLEYRAGKTGFKPKGLAIDDQGRILVVDFNNGQVIVFNQEGQILSRIKVNLENPWSLCLSHSQSFWVGCYGSETVCEYKYT